MRATSHSRFLLYHVLFLTAEVPPRLAPPLPTASTPTSLRVRPYLSSATGNSTVFPPLYLSRTCSVFAPLRFRHFPRRSFVTTLLSLLILIDTTSRARVCPRQPSSAVFFYSALSARMHHVRPSLCLEPRSPFPPSPLHSSLFVNSRSSSHHVAPRLCPSFPNVPMSVRLFDYVSPAFPYLATYLRARHWLMADSDCPFPLRRSPSCRSLCALFYCSD